MRTPSNPPRGYKQTQPATTDRPQRVVRACVRDYIRQLDVNYLQEPQGFWKCTSPEIVRHYGLDLGNVELPSRMPFSRAEKFVTDELREEWKRGHIAREPTSRRDINGKLLPIEWCSMVAALEDPTKWSIYGR